MLLRKLAIRTELRRINPACMLHRLADWFAAWHIPELCRLVARGGHDPLAIRTELRRINQAVNREFFDNQSI